MQSTFRQYWPLTKPRVVALIVFTALVGMLLAVPGIPPWRALLFGNLGIWLAAASAAAINHLIDQRIDALMARTQHRPLPAGHLNGPQVLIFAVSLGLASMLILVLWVNVLTALLTFASLDWLCGDLYRVSEARDAAKHRDRWCGGRGTARAGLGGGDRRGRPARLAVVFDHLHLDATAFLGAGDFRRDDYAPRRDSHAAGDAWLPFCWGYGF
jgi:hypothetical protein